MSCIVESVSDEENVGIRFEINNLISFKRPSRPQLVQP